MTTLIDRTLRKQKETLKSVNNARFHLNGMEYKISYDGGIGEYISVYGRENNERFRFINGFHAYKLKTKDDVIGMAMRKVFKP